MYAVHAVFRSAFAAAPTFVGQAADADAARTELVADYYATVLELLKHHHDGEDVLLTPRLLERLPEQAETVSRIAGQHEDVHEAVHGVERSLAAWRTDASSASRGEVLAAIAALDASLIPHLDEEEREILPLAASCINVAEWGEMPEHAMKSYAGDKPWLILGLIAEQMTPEQRAGMEAHLPPPVAEFWLGPGKALFTDFTTALRAS
jgi:hypothetical protein